MVNKMVNSQDEGESKELTNQQQGWLNNYAQKGNEEIDNENYEHAIGWFNKAMEIIPEPKDKWAATVWLSASIGDAYYCIKNYKDGIVNLRRAYHLYGTDLINPIVLLRLGQCYFHLNDEERAKKYLLKAYLSEGIDMFEDEQLYLNFLKSKVLI